LTAVAAVRGTVAPGKVVAVNYGAGTNFVRVQLPAPVGHVVGLDAWSGDGPRPARC
jgi:hypothetical protein